MRTRSQKIIRHLPELRRYAHALLGSRQSGDTQLRVMLEAFLRSPGELNGRRDPRRELFRFFHTVVHTLQSPFERAAEQSTDGRLRDAVAALPLRNREALLLTSLTGFDAAQAAEILGITRVGAERALANARDQVRHHLSTRILIVDDQQREEVRRGHPRRSSRRRAAARGAARRQVSARDVGDAITDALAAPTVKANVLRG